LRPQKPVVIESSRSEHTKKFSVFFRISLIFLGFGTEGVCMVFFIYRKGTTVLWQSNSRKTQARRSDAFSAPRACELHKPSLK